MHPEPRATAHFHDGGLNKRERNYITAYAAHRDAIVDAEDPIAQNHEVACQRCSRSGRLLVYFLRPMHQNTYPVEDVWLQAKNFLRKFWVIGKSFAAVKWLFKFEINHQKFDFPKRLFEKFGELAN